MKTSKAVPSFRRERGFSFVTALIILVIIVGIAAAAWFLIIHPHRQATQSGRLAASAGQQASGKAAPPPANVAAMSNSQLLAEASDAIQDQRLLAPAGNNAFEFYLSVLDREPNNQVAKDALREIFPFAANAAEQVINRGNFDEAEREIGLLAKAAPDNYTLTILRSKLDARRRVAAHQQQAEALAEQKEAAAAQAQALAQAQADAKAKLAAQAKQLATAQAKQKAAEAAAERARQAQIAQQKQQAEKAKVVIKNAQLVQQVSPRYPPAAARMRQRGWVEVQFTVGVDGDVHDAHVIDAQPSHVFDHAAVSAVSQWRYKPATRNGKPIPVTMRQRIEFKLQR